MMLRDRPKGRLPADLTCVRCLEIKPTEELDRLLWCDECLASAKRRAMVRGWIAGGVLFVILALYVLVWVQPDFSLIPTAWIMMLLVAFYLGARVAREFAFAWDRLRNRGAVEATPPVQAPKHKGEDEAQAHW